MTCSTDCPDLRQHPEGYLQYDDDGKWIYETKGPNKGRPKLGTKRNEILWKKMEERKENWDSPDTPYSNKDTYLESIDYDFRDRLKTDRYGAIVLGGRFKN
jgi:hypothetical protein